MSEKIKAFHGLVNYGTQSGFFARELRRKGFEAVSVAGCDKFDRLHDVTLKFSTKKITKSFINRVYNLVWNSIFKLNCFFKYNIFHFYFGESLTKGNWDLPFYKIFNKKLVFHYLGIDVQLYQYSVDKYEITNVATYLKDVKDHDKKVLRRLERENKYANLQLVCAPYLSEFVPQADVLPLAIDLAEYSFSPKKNINEEIVIMHAPTSRDNKGTSYILNAIEQLKEEGYKIKTLLVEKVTHEKLKEQYLDCDIFIDQILAGWYGTASIEAMALGRPTICFLREEYFKYIDYWQDIPIINANPNTIYKVLKNTIEEREQLYNIGFNSRKFVEAVHDVKKLTDRLIQYYEQVLNETKTK